MKTLKKGTIRRASILDILLEPHVQIMLVLETKQFPIKQGPDENSLTDALNSTVISQNRADGVY